MKNQVNLSRRCGLEVTSPLRKRKIHGSNRGRGKLKKTIKKFIQNNIGHNVTP